MSGWERPAEGPEDVEVFATGATALLDRDDQEPIGAGVVEALRRGGDAFRDFHARPGHRPGEVIASTSGRRSGDTDIVRPVLVNPRLACAFAMSGRLFGDPVDGLEVDDRAGTADGGRFLVWTARLSGAYVRSVPVSFHLLASPSMVVTVLELVPQRRLRWRRDDFVRDGVDVVERLARRLTIACGASAAVHSAG